MLREASSLKMNIMSVEWRQEEDGEGRPRGSALPGVEVRVEDRSGEQGVPWRCVFFFFFNLALGVLK